MRLEHRLPNCPLSRWQDLLISTPVAVELRTASHARSAPSFSISQTEWTIYFDVMSDKNKCDVLGKVFQPQKVLKTEGEKDRIPEL